MPVERFSGGWTHRPLGFSPPLRVTVGWSSIRRASSDYSLSELQLKGRLWRNYWSTFDILGHLLVVSPTDVAGEHVAKGILTHGPQGGHGAVINPGEFCDQLSLAAASSRFPVASPND